MSRSERRAYLHAIAARYEVAGRAQKSVMLDEYCATVQVSRKHAIARIGCAVKALADEGRRDTASASTAHGKASALRG